MTLTVSGLEHMASSERRRDGLTADLARAGYLRGAFARQDEGWTTWFQTELVLTRPALLRRCASLLAADIPDRADRLAARGAAAVALATTISVHLNISLLLLSDDDGGEVAIGGEPFPGARVVLVEDVVLTGRHALRSIAALRAAQLDVIAVIGLIDREQQGRSRIEETDGVTTRFVFREQDLQP